MRSINSGLTVAAVLIAALGSAQLTQAQDAGAIAFTGARLFDGTGSAPIEQATLVIRDGRVAAVGAANEVSIPADAQRIDASGKTIMPGLVNAHGHINEGFAAASARDSLMAQLRQYASYGVTTVVVLGIQEQNFEPALRLRDEQRNGQALDGARAYIAGPSLQNLETAAEARARVNAYADAGADVVKIHITGSPNDTPPEVYGALIDQAHSRGLEVSAHMYYLEDARGLVDAGVDVLAHSVRDQDVDAALIDEIKRRNVGYTPTLTRDLARFVYEGIPDFLSDPFFLQRAEPYAAEIELVRDPARQEEMRTSEVRQADKIGLQRGERNLKTLSDAGVLIGLGTDTGTNDGQWQGYFEHVELEMMVDVGMTPMQVLVAATGGAARTAGLDDDLGTLRPGLAADLLVLDANPLDDIRATRQIDSVWIAGKQLSYVP
jgi:imidazolonepropionase-like amidohydrolase